MLPRIPASLLALLVLAALALPAPAQVLFVDAASDAATPDGTGWSTAFPHLHQALRAAAADAGIEEIWVAEGVYAPDPAGGPEATFRLHDGVALYGGFAGSETSREERDWHTHPTVLSGDLDGDDLDPDGDGVIAPDDQRGRNSFHVVSAEGVGRSARLDGFVITGGRAEGASHPHNRGGGVLLLDAAPTLANCRIAGNRARVEGGGLYAGPGSQPYVVTSAFLGNEAELGGGLFALRSRPQIANTVLSGNAAAYGGGVLLWVGADATLTHVTIAGNAATVSGGGLYVFSGSRPQLVNSILWGNGAGVEGPDVLAFGDGRPTFRHALVGGSGGSDTWDAPVGVDAGANLDADPGFVDPAAPTEAPTLAGRYQLLPGSPALDAGASPVDTDAVLAGIQPLPEADAAGRPRHQRQAPDLGAYEDYRCPAGPVLYVDADAPPPGDGSSWARAFPFLQSALATARQCRGARELWIAAGTYHPDDGVGQRAGNVLASFIIPDSTTLLGGFAGSETTRGERDADRFLTLLSGDLDRDDQRFGPRRTVVGDNSIHVVTTSGTGPETLLDGLTITGGHAFGSGISNRRRRGGGLYNRNGSPTLRRVILTANAASRSGAGIYSLDGSPRLINVTLSFNETSGGRGAGLHATGGTPLLVNAVLYQNTAFTGGGLSLDGSNARIVNTTVAANNAQRGAAAFISLGSAPTLTNSIFWGNVDVDGRPFLVDRSAPLVRHSLLAGSGGSVGWQPAFGIDGGGNLDADPLFLNLTEGNLHLADGSPAVNRGDTGALPLDAADLDLDGILDEPIPFDHAGNLRVMNGAVDLGAYESLHRPTSTAPGTDDPPLPLQLWTPHPNPARAATSVAYRTDRAGPVHLAAFDLLGRRVATLADASLPAGLHRHVIDVSGWQAGVYVLRLRTDRAIVTTRFVRVK